MTRQDIASGLLQVAGLAVLAIGVSLIYPPAGVIVAGGALFAIGLISGLPPRKRQ